MQDQQVVQDLSQRRPGSTGYASPRATYGRLKNVPRSKFIFVHQSSISAAIDTLKTDKSLHLLMKLSKPCKFLSLVLMLEPPKLEDLPTFEDDNHISTIMLKVLHYHCLIVVMFLRSCFHQHSPRVSAVCSPSNKTVATSASFKVTGQRQYSWKMKGMIALIDANVVAYRCAASCDRREQGVII